MRDQSIITGVPSLRAHQQFLDVFISLEISETKMAIYPLEGFLAREP
jgi:hypothetical protein